MSSRTSGSCCCSRSTIMNDTMANHCHRDRRSLSIRPGNRSRFINDAPLPGFTGREARMHATAKNPERSSPSKAICTFMGNTVARCKPSAVPCDGNGSGSLAQAGETHVGRAARRHDKNVRTYLLYSHFSLPTSERPEGPERPGPGSPAPPVPSHGRARLPPCLAGAEGDRPERTVRRWCSPRSSVSRFQGIIFVGKSIEHDEIVASPPRPAESLLPFAQDRSRDRGRARPSKMSPASR
jgi:hypothetical protein